MRFDEATSRRIEAVYTTPDVVEQRRVVLAHLRLQEDERVLDIGSGPGFLAREMARVVGRGGSVTGLDASDTMLAMSRARPPEAGSRPVSFHQGLATALPFPDGAFDAVTSTQVYEYVDDVRGALLEARRVLRGDGRLLVLDTDWDSIVWRCSDAGRMRQVLAAWDDHLVDPHLPQRLGELLIGAGFTVTVRAVVPLLNAGYDPDTYSAGLIGVIHAFVAGRRGVTAAEADAWAEDLAAQGPGYFFSLNRYLFVATRSGP
jgi:SAM-dependent methyltransferase